MRLLVTGGRNYSDRSTIRNVLGNLRPDVVIHGAARGADTLAGQEAKSLGFGIEEFHANWTKHGLGAGAIRNQKMLDIGKPDIVVAFAGGKGTADMVHRAKAAGLVVLYVGEP